jgi:hypothetical protein
MTSLICQWHQHGEIREPVPRVTRHGLPRTHGAVRDGGGGVDGGRGIGWNSVPSGA